MSTPGKNEISPALWGANGVVFIIGAPQLVCLGTTKVPGHSTYLNRRLTIQIKRREPVSESEQIPKPKTGPSGQKVNRT